MSQILFIPGLLCTKAIFASQLDAFEGIASCHVADTTAMDTITKMAEKALATMSGNFAVLGFSMGGYVALEIMRLAPERITGLALVSTSAKADTDEKRKARQDLIELSKIGKFKGVTPRLLPRFFSPDALQDEAKTAIVLAMGAEIGQQNFMHQQEAIMSRRDQRRHLGDIHHQTVVICGTKDVLTPPEESQEMADLLPHARLHLLEDIGHMSTLEAPEAVNQILLDWYRAL
ncbi:MAG: alpha/beta fold hydrolase [Candidatus Puniceispirillaceae bacterium]